MTQETQNSPQTLLKEAFELVAGTRVPGVFSARHNSLVPADLRRLESLLSAAVATPEVQCNKPLVEALSNSLEAIAAHGKLRKTVMEWIPGDTLDSQKRAHTLTDAGRYVEMPNPERRQANAALQKKLYPALKKAQR